MYYTPHGKFVLTQLSTTQLVIVEERLSMGITSFKTPNTQIITSSPARPKRMPLNQDTLLADLNALIQACPAPEELFAIDKQARITSQTWVMDQIEQAMLRLPIPKSSQQNKPYYPAIDFYSSITTPEDVEKIEAALDALQSLYVNACNIVLKKNVIPSQFITEFSFFVLRDYFVEKREAFSKKPSFHPYIYHFLATVLSGLTHSPYLATDNPAFDQRVKQLLNGFSNVQLHQISNLKTWYEDYCASCLKQWPELHDECQKDKYQAVFEGYTAWLRKSLHEKGLTTLWIAQQSKMADLECISLFKELKQRQSALEIFFIKGKNLLTGKTDVISALKVLIDPSEKSKDVYCNCPISKDYLDISKSIPSHKYNLPPSPSLSALLQGHNAISRSDFRDYQKNRRYLNGNEVQLVPHDATQSTRVIGKEDYFNRDLFHLRLVPEQQIKLTLDYFNKSEFIGQLDSLNLQLYVEANLFEPGLLWTAMNDFPQLLPRVDAFVSKGLDYFANANHLLNQQSMFFIRLKTVMHNYASLFNGKIMDELIADQHWLSKLIEQQTDSTTLAQLHTYRFFNAITQYQLEPDRVDPSLLASTVESYFYMQTKHEPHDTASYFEQHRAELDFKRWLQTADPAIIESLIEPVMRNLLPELENASLSIHLKQHPVYQVVDNITSNIYTFNAEQGRIFQNGIAFGPVPLDYKNHPALRAAGLKDASLCLLHEDGETISFEHPCHVRIKKEEWGVAIQKEWRSNTWYELKALSAQQVARFGVKLLEDSRSVPTMLIDDAIEVWIGEADALFVKNGQPIYQVDKQGKFYPLDKHGKKTDQILFSKPYYYAGVLTYLEQFESDSFFMVNLDEATHKNGTIDFPRYGFSLTLSDEKIMLPGTTYTLLPPKSSVFSPDIASLQFSNGTDQQCIVAVLPFCCGVRDIEGHYYQLTHDILGTIPQKQLAEYWENQDIKDPPVVWSHHDSAHSLTYKLVNGEPKPETAADALYLCYLYLATHEVDKAWAVLNDIHQRLTLTGSMDELTYLSWIVQALPVIIEEKDEKATHETPDYVACQLKALALYTDFLKLNEALVFPTNKLFDKTYANGYYDEICFKNTKIFCEQLPSTIETLYSRHQRAARHLDEKYTLRDEECLSLLNFCLKKSPSSDETPTVVGTLGYEHRRLSLKMLLQDYRRLDAIQVAAATSGHSLPVNFTKRLEDIKQQITEENSIAKISTKLKKSAIDLSLPAVMKTLDLPPELRKLIDSWNLNGLKKFAPDAALSSLSSDMKQSTLIKHFPTLLNIARVGTPEQKAQLEQFCILYL